MDVYDYLDQNYIDDHPKPDEALDSIEQTNLMYEALKTLKGVDKRAYNVIRLRYFKNYTLQMLSKKYGRTRECMRVIILEGLKELRCYMEDPTAYECIRSNINILISYYKSLKRSESKYINDLKPVHQLIKYLPKLNGYVRCDQRYFDALKKVANTNIETRKRQDKTRTERARKAALISWKKRRIEMEERRKREEAERQAKLNRRAEVRALMEEYAPQQKTIEDLKEQYRRDRDEIELRTDRRCYCLILQFLMCQCTKCAAYKAAGNLAMHEKFKDGCAFVQDFIRIPFEGLRATLDLPKIVKVYNIKNFLNERRVNNGRQTSTSQEERQADNGAPTSNLRGDCYKDRPKIQVPVRPWYDWYSERFECTRSADDLQLPEQ